MLGFVLMTRNEGRRLDLGLRRLAVALQDGAESGAELLVIDAGSQDDTLARLQAFVAGPGRGAEILRLDAGPIHMQAGLRLARDRLEAPYLLGLTGQDLICPAAIGPLRARLRAEQPDMMICNHGWWLAGPASVLDCADADRMAALAKTGTGAGKGDRAPERAALHRLLADPRRLVAGPDVAAAEAGADWDVYDAALDRAGRVSVFGDPVLLRPVPGDRLAGLFGLAEAKLRACPGPQRPALLERLLQRLGDAMMFCDPGRAADTLAAAEQFRAAPAWRLRDAGKTRPGPAAQLLEALQSGGAPAGLAVLAVQAAAQDRARLLALSAEIQALREDLDLALPGPDYLLELYERVRLR